MIGYLNGTIHKKLPKSIILKTGTIGYVVNVTTPLLEKINEGAEMELFIHTKVREDDISLFGFETFPELEFFKILLSVNGIGPKLGLEILSHQPAKTKAAILTGDLFFLSKIPGIGKKTAERIVVELKNKIDLEDIGQLGHQQSLHANDEVIEALQKLGYQKYEITKILKNLPAHTTTTEAIITYFLQNV